MSNRFLLRIAPISACVGSGVAACICTRKVSMQRAVGKKISWTGSVVSLGYTHIDTTAKKQRIRHRNEPTKRCIWRRRHMQRDIFYVFFFCCWEKRNDLWFWSNSHREFHGIPIAYKIHTLVKRYESWFLCFSILLFSTALFLSSCVEHAILEWLRETRLERTMTDVLKAVSLSSCMTKIRLVYFESWYFVITLELRIYDSNGVT